MDNFTTNNYEMKRDIINFSEKISEGTSKPESKSLKTNVYLWFYQVARFTNFLFFNNLFL